MHITRRAFLRTSAATLGAAALMLSGCGKGKSSSGVDGNVATITNVSYDPTRELYEAYNELFCGYYAEATGMDLTVVQSHGGSGSQSRSVMEGAEADVVTLALEHDISTLEKAGLMESGWIDDFPNDSSPYTSTIVLLVRAGNPKNILDWDDLTRSGIDVITPDPKSSGGAMWNFLAAWDFASNLYPNDDKKVRRFMSDLYANVAVMNSGARGATTTFVENGQGDVLIAWENEALISVSEYPDDFEIVSPSSSILCKPTVAVVSANAAENGTAEIAHDYLAYLYEDESQRIIGEYGYRPINEEILQEFSDKFDLNMSLCTIADFGGWDEAYATYFKDGGIFDDIYLA